MKLIYIYVLIRKKKYINSSVKEKNKNILTHSIYILKILKERVYVNLKEYYGKLDLKILFHQQFSN